MPPRSLESVPLVSVMRKSWFACSALGITYENVLPLPVPPMTRMFLARLHSLLRRDWSTASPTRRVRMMLLSGSLVSENLLAASTGGSHRALPCSSPWRKLPPASTARLQASHTATAQTVPARSGPRPGETGPCAAT